MGIFDLHCDALLRLQMDPSLSFTDSPELDVNLEKLQQGGVQVQLFAVFVEPDIPFDKKFEHAAEQVDLFHKKVLEPHEQVVHITSWEQILTLEENQIGAVLTLEGADAFGNDPEKLRWFYRAGVLSMGLTWNNANLTADGIGEPRGGGLTEWGMEVVRENNKHGVWTDVSHLSLQAFDDVIIEADYPVATHSNVYAVCGHRRNLNDDQIQALIERGGLMGMVFNPPFTADIEEEASIQGLIEHIQAVHHAGGADILALGSDFDGIETKIPELSDASEYPNLIHQLEGVLEDADTAKIKYGNAIQFIKKHFSS
ncbi:dipeptidase [Alkalicoccus chagannorensis]|uniref:dipeptidase n=1 Tax=Alkalicoccus chagannorensis TaxID=427072 RepID=UPI0003FF17EF|nr:dipeptidase [Alkalicoccus chagannorensis]